MAAGRGGVSVGVGRVLFTGGLSDGLSDFSGSSSDPSAARGEGAVAEMLPCTVLDGVRGARWDWVFEVCSPFSSFVCWV